MYRKSLHPSNQAQETVRQGVRFVGMYLFILFIIFPILILPAAASKNDICLAKPPVSILRSFFHQVVVANSVQRHVSNFAWWTAPSAYWKNMDFSIPRSPLCDVRLLLPSSTHVLTIKELGHCASKFEQTNLMLKLCGLISSKLWFVPRLFIYAVCELACGEEVYVIQSERQQTKWPFEAGWG